MQERKKKKIKKGQSLFHTEWKCRGLRNIQGQRSTPSIKTTQFKPEIKITFLLFRKSG